MMENIQGAEKMSPSLKTLIDYISGSHGAVTQENVTRSYSKLTVSEKESYRTSLKERRATLKSIVALHPTESARAEHVRALEAIKQICGFLEIDQDLE